jgi:hypothetical protein
MTIFARDVRTHRIAAESGSEHGESPVSLHPDLRLPGFHRTRRNRNGIGISRAARPVQLVRHLDLDVYAIPRQGVFICSDSRRARRARPTITCILQTKRWRFRQGRLAEPSARAAHSHGTGGRPRTPEKTGHWPGTFSAIRDVPPYWQGPAAHTAFTHTGTRRTLDRGKPERVRVWVREDGGQRYRCRGERSRLVPSNTIKNKLFCNGGILE